ncbi:hypothetical protein GLAREA_12256 [Glarea lozoyensis ATCC 20868]|uniref:Uncharacterized protein n=1 Tax=Glarea lozoyensis (strain ATCC 20868 / MF5171) TaxID=1116229 RepID=S3D0W7_GLAL2|nr:uncharacterized protein GLAREA_12256 [Glarea lozoyensis ATCC 20868]EPE31500.1 hypothetical protein GLAREA_12256 [Glarea lozoyensis ATCC 20868]
MDMDDTGDICCMACGQDLQTDDSMNIGRSLTGDLSYSNTSKASPSSPLPIRTIPRNDSNLSQMLNEMTEYEKSQPAERELSIDYSYSTTRGVSVEYSYSSRKPLQVLLDESDEDDDDDLEFEDVLLEDLQEIQARDEIDTNELSQILAENPVSDATTTPPKSRKGSKDLLKRSPRSSSGNWLSASLATAEAEHAKWKEAEDYEDELMEKGFTLVDAIISDGELLLDEDRKLAQYRANYPSPLRRCWIVPNEEEQSKGKLNGKQDSGYWDYFDEEMEVDGEGRDGVRI